MKEFGEGVDRVYRDMEEAGLPEPVYCQSEFMLYATIKTGGKDTLVTTYDKKNLLEFCTIRRYLGILSQTFVRMWKP